LAEAKAFPTPPQFLNDICVDEGGTLYVTDSGDFKGAGGAVYRVNARGRVELVADGNRHPALKTPNGVVIAGSGERPGTMHLHVLDFTTGELHWLKLADGSLTKVADGFGGGDGVAWDHHGRLYVSDHKGGRVFVIPRPGQAPVLLASGFQAPADLCLDPTGKQILVPDMKAGTITALPAQVPGAPVDETPLPLETAVSFPDLQWTDWSPETPAGRPVALRVLRLLHGPERQVD
jgi:sugar lactone lactonase YvrE